MEAPGTYVPDNSSFSERVRKSCNRIQNSTRRRIRRQVNLLCVDRVFKDGVGSGSYISNSLPRNWWLSARGKKKREREREREGGPV